MDKESNKEKILEWQKESSRRYVGYVHCWIYENEEYVVDASKEKDMAEMGAKKTGFVFP